MKDFDFNSDFNSLTEEEKKVVIDDILSTDTDTNDTNVTSDKSNKQYIQNQYTQEEKERAYELFDQGMSIIYISNMLNIPQYIVSGWNKERIEKEGYIGIKRDVLMMLDEGLSQGEVCRRTGVPKSTISRWWQNSHKEQYIGKEKKPRNTYTRAQKDEAIEMLDNGMKTKDVSDKIGACVGTVLEWRDVRNQKWLKGKTKIYDLLDSGMTYIDINQKYGINYDSVQKLAEERNKENKEKEKEESEEN